ncbi:MAG: alpha/beta hydrolase [Ignavibacteriota bacterium]
MRIGLTASLTIGLLMSVGWPPPAAAQVLPQAAQMTNTKNILLVHGAWSDGSSFQKVIPLLQQEGFSVVSVQIPLTSFADDVATAKRALALETGPVLLVAHSYGGAVITEIGSDPKVAGLVYLAALAPRRWGVHVLFARLRSQPRRSFRS